jgi:hypothetical protein
MSSDGRTGTTATVCSPEIFGEHKIENYSREPLSQNSTDLHESFLHSADSSLYKVWSPGVGKDHNRGNSFYMCILEKIFWMRHLVNFNQTWYKSFLHEGNSSLFKWRVKSSSKGGGWIDWLIDGLIDWLIDGLIIVLRSAKQFFTYMEASPLPVIKRGEG